MSGSVYKNVCPICHYKMRVRNSVSDHPLMRIMYLQCLNLTCGATYRSELEITHLMSPSAIENTSINLPLADSAMRAAAMKEESTKQIDMIEQLNAEAVANDHV
jgi:hypothetical protein